MRKIVTNHLPNKRLKSRMHKGLTSRGSSHEKGAENSNGLSPKGINKGTMNEIRRTYERVRTAHFHFRELQHQLPEARGEEDGLSSAGRQDFSTSDGKFPQMDTVGGYKKKKTYSI